jgi:hypothetical protein
MNRKRLVLLISKGINLGLEVTLVLGKYSAFMRESQ